MLPCNSRHRQKVFLVRSLEELTDRRASGRDMSRVLGVLDLLLLGIGSIIGAGVVVLTGLAAREYAGKLLEKYHQQDIDRLCIFIALDLSIHTSARKTV